MTETPDSELLDQEGAKIYWYRQGKDDGVKHERAAIVRWLRNWWDGLGDTDLKDAADAIEAGAHLEARN